MTKKLLMMLFCVMLSLSITGCGKDQRLETYKTSMNTFHADMLEKTDALDAIDPASSTATADMLATLDELDALFLTLAEIEVPKEFAGAESLADEASELMSQAVALYHNAYDEEFDPYTAEAALAYYERALKRVEYIGDILSGTIPDDENITVVTEEATDSE